MDKDVRAAVVNRADGCCEACGRGVGENGEFDHYFSRREADHVSTGWYLCRECHFRRTRNEPSAQHWIRRFMEHCKKFGFEVSHQRAAARLAVQVLKWGEQP